MNSVKIIIEQRKKGIVAYPADFASQELIGKGATPTEALEPKVGAKYKMTTEEITKIGEAAVEEFLADITPEELARYKSYNRRDDDED
ncbi:MAG: hypothetical protein MUF71_15755 [Candidatus Kapabacteria bacterium]|jgi:hypothetical protein|nr:hypothetical protein [Candidatus Kapabacteria bacterium]